MIIIALLCILSIAIILVDYIRSGWILILNPFFYGLFFSFIYLLIPSLFVDKINYYFEWGIEYENIIYSHVFVSLFIVPIFIIYLVFPSCKLIRYGSGLKINSSPIITFIWIFSLFYSLFVLWVTIGEVKGGYFIYDFTQEDKYKIKNLSYLLICVSVYFYCATGNRISFVPCVILGLIDLLHGSRTVAMIALTPLVLSMCCRNEKLYAFPIISIFSLLLFIGVYRLDEHLVSGIPWYIHAMGEFRETYITLPIFVTNEDYVGASGIDNVIAMFLNGIAHPLRSVIAEVYVFPGTFKSNYLQRGYGLASNIIVNSLHYGYVFTIFTGILFYSFLVLCYRIVLMLSMVNKLIFMSFFIVFSRLIIREGVYSSVGVMIFVILVYWLPFVIFRKMTFIRSYKS
ncbi:hypothetical protein VCSRO150_2278 [Vibrio cholerae]|nr:putative O-antigen polymerase [Vibrio cholerae]GHW27474.1 hypothetical protein VCSRO150_2278 [Vibrio cholerae]